MKINLSRINFFKSKRDTKSVVIAVLGMHRSGTSCLTGLLEESGIFLGEVSKKDPFNKKGNHELKSIRLLHQEVLEANHADWDNPPTSKCKWNREQITKLKAIISSRDCHKIWGFKDPRTLLLMDQWFSIVPDLRFIGTFRNPKAVAQSLYNRGKVPMETGLSLWETYNQKIKDLWTKKPFPIVNFDLTPEAYMVAVKTGISELDLPLQTTELQFFDVKLRNANNEETDIQLTESQEALYRWLLSVSKCD